MLILKIRGYNVRVKVEAKRDNEGVEINAFVQWDSKSEYVMGAPSGALKMMEYNLVSGKKYQYSDKNEDANIQTFIAEFNSEGLITSMCGDFPRHTAIQFVDAVKAYATWTTFEPLLLQFITVNWYNVVPEIEKILKKLKPASRLITPGGSPIIGG